MLASAARPEGRECRAGEVVPDAEDGARQCRERREILLSEHDAEPRVLHADFDRERARFGFGETHPFGYAVAGPESEPVVENDGGEDRDSDIADLVMIARDDDGDDEHDGGNGEERARVLRFAER